MIELLSRLFIKDYKNKSNIKVRERYGILCGGVGIALNVLLFAGKALAGLLSGSIAITADAFNNLSDAGTSLITLIGFKLGGEKPDEEHPFGHGRMEYLSGLAVSIIIILMAVELLKVSFGKIIHPEIPECSLIIIVILIASILVKLYMGYYNNKYGKEMDSKAMIATAKDSLSDVVSTGVVLISALVGFYLRVPIDGYCGLFVGLLILKTGIDSVKDTISPLLGQAPEQEFVDSIKSIVLAHDIVLDIHDLIVHDYGPGRVMISLHAEVPYKEDILKIHDEIDIIEAELKYKLNCHAVIHMDPVVDDSEELQSVKMKVTEIIGSIDSNLQFHDLRMVEGPTHTNILFDVVVPYNYHMSDNELKKVIFCEIQKYNPTYYAVIAVDHSFVK